MTSELAEYDALVAKVDTSCERIVSRRGRDLSCRAGCDECCQVQLSVSRVEAEAIGRHLRGLPAAVRDRLAQRALEEGPPACVMLADGRCSIYPARPLVCRTQGLPLCYPGDLVPVDSVARATTAAGTVTWCRLNFTESPPAADDVLDAQRIDELLAVVNARWARRQNVDPLTRVPLRSLAESGRP